MHTLRLAGPPETVGASGTLTFVSVTECRDYLELPSSAALDALLRVLIDSASVGAFGQMGGRFIKAITGGDFFDFAFTPWDAGVIHLPQFPVTAVALVELGYMSADQVWTSTSVVPSTSYYLDRRSGRLYGSWPEAMNSVRVRWQGGFSPVPADASEAAMMWVGVKLSRARMKRWDATSLQGATEGWTFGGELPAAAAEVFLKYAIPEASIA